MSNRTPAKLFKAEPKPVQQNALSEKTEFQKKMLVTAFQKHLEFFIKGESDLCEVMSTIENQLISYCHSVGRVDDIIVYYNDNDEENSSCDDSENEDTAAGRGMVVDD